MRRWRFAKFPLIVDGNRDVLEATAIIDCLDIVAPESTRTIPFAPLAAVEVLQLDRVFDNYVMVPVQTIVGNALRFADARAPIGVDRAHALLATSCAWLDEWMHTRQWAAGEPFTLADYAAAPSLFYVDWVHPISNEHAALKAYRARLLRRPSVQRYVDEARPYRPIFPLGAPDRD